MGRLVASALADAGIAVGLIARSSDELGESVELIEASGGVGTAVAADVADERAAARAITELRRRLGPIGLLVNNARITGPAGPVWDLDPGVWWRTVEVNLRGTVQCTRLVLPDMLRRGSGRIVNVTSQAGVSRWPTVSAYSVSKAAVIKFTENLAWETRRHGIDAFSVHPGLLPIGLTEVALSDRRPENPAQAGVSHGSVASSTPAGGPTPLAPSS